jgi:hypothetical protein
MLGAVVTFACTRARSRVRTFEVGSMTSEKETPAFSDESFEGHPVRGSCDKPAMTSRIQSDRFLRPLLFRIKRNEYDRYAHSLPRGILPDLLEEIRRWSCWAPRPPESGGQRGPKGRARGGSPTKPYRGAALEPPLARSRLRLDRAVLLTQRDALLKLLERASRSYSTSRIRRRLPGHVH